MKSRLAVGVIGVAAVVSACAPEERMVAPGQTRLKWGWDNPLGTGGSFPSLICTPTTVAQGGSVSCAFANGGPLNNPIWKFYTETGLTVDGPVGTGGWAGNMAIGGDVVVNWIDPSTMSAGQPLVQTITVQRRNWSWASSVGGQVGTPGEIDSCFGSSFGTVGLTASKNCTETTAPILFTPAAISNGNGYVAASVPAGVSNGPNQGLWYVASVSADMDLRTQWTKKFRADGDALPMTVARP